MPYIIETRSHAYGGGYTTNGQPDARTAVATLDEAQEAVQRVLAPFDAEALPAPDDDLNDYSRAYFSACADKECMDESGGTVGPLPDGTVIEVTRVDWMDFERKHRDQSQPLPDIATFDNDSYRAGLIAAFNAA